MPLLYIDRKESRILNAYSKHDYSGILSPKILMNKNLLKIIVDNILVYEAKE